MLDAVMYPIDDPIDRLNFMVDDDVILPVGVDLSLSRDYDMIVWKKALNIKFSPSSGYDPVIVKLKIPKDAAVLFTPTKCRASRAIVLGFYRSFYCGAVLSQLDITSAMSWYDHAFIYNLGEEIVPDYFNSDWRKTCSHGIHFFRNLNDAVAYEF